MAPNPRPTYPHVDSITDWPTKQTVKLLWDEIHALRTQQAAAEAAATSAQAKVASLESQVATAHELATRAIAKTTNILR